ncbi:MAG: YfhO family protein [Acidobacteriota bacterium]
MGALWLALLYAVTAVAISALGRRWLRGRPSRWVPIVLALVPLLFTGAGFLPGKTLAPTASLAGVAPWADGELVERSRAASMAANPLLLDPLSQMIPWSRAARRDLLFNPHQGAGSALLGNGQSAVLFPTELAARLLPPFRAVTYRQAARLLIALWGMFLVARRLGVGDRAALVAAALYGGSGFLQLWRLHPHSLVAAVLPWILAAALDLSRSPSWRAARRLAWAGALGVFAGHPETLLHGLLLTAPLALFCGRWRQRRRIVGWGLVAALLALLLAAPVLLPMVETLSASAEWQQGRTSRLVQTGGSWSDSVDRLLPALSLGAHGDPRRGDWQGPENLIEIGGASVGASAVLLGLLAVTLRRRRKVVLALAAVGLFGLLAGALVPPVVAPLSAIPLVADSLLKRFALGWCLAVPLLAAMTLHHHGRVRRRWILALSAVLALAVATVMAGHSPAEQMFFFTPILVTAVALGLAKRKEAWALPAVIVALLLPRVALFATWVPVVSADAFYPETLGVREVAARLAASEPVGYRVAGLDAALVPQTAAFFGFEEARSYDPMEFAPYREFSAALGEVGRTGWVRILDPDRPALDFLGVRYVFDDPSMVQRPGVEVIYQGRDAVIYENPGALPRLFVPQFVELAETGDAVRRAVQLDDFARTAIVSGRPGGSPGGGPGGGRRNGPGRVEDLRVAGATIDALVVAEGPLLVASSQPAIPGWRLWLDGVETPLRRVNGAFLGLEVPAGRHRVELRYRPWTWDLGRGAFAIGLGLLTLGWAMRWR